MSYREETLTVRDRHIRLMRAGIGQPLLYLHDTLSDTWTPVHDALAEHYEVIFPIHPGCAGSGDLDDIEGMDDLVFHYLDVCAMLGLQHPVLLGPSLGGWLAAEWAVRYPEMLRAIMLVDAFGLRVPEAPATDLLRLDPAQLRAVLFADPQLLWPRKSSPIRQLQSPLKGACGRVRHWRALPGSSLIIPSCGATCTVSRRQR